MQYQPNVSMWRTPSGLVLLGFLAVAAFCLRTEHLMLLACPLMYLLMHHGHGGRGAHGQRSDEEPDGGTP